MPESHHFHTFVKEVYLDTLGHMNHSVYLTIFDEARWEFLTSRGYGMVKIQETGFGPIVLEVTLRFLKELKLRDQITVETALVSYEGKVGKLAQKIYRNDELCCDAEFVYGFFDLKLRRIVQPTPEWLEALSK